MSMPVLMESHDKKGHVTPHFNHLYLRNAVMPSMMHLASCDMDPDTNAITCPKIHIAPHFDYLDMRNVMVPLLMPSSSCHTNAGANHVT